LTGAVHKTEEELNDYFIKTASDVDNERHKEGNSNDKRAEEEDEAVQMVKAFSAENRDSHFDWDKHYGGGFSLLNFKVFVDNNPQHLEAPDSQQSLKE